MTVLRPTAAQLAWQRSRLGVFLHVGLNTFHGVEWSDGSLPASSFDPEDLDADQWVRVAVEAGAAYVVLTAKHHDGFCLWPTETTDYSVASSPWRSGHGDVVGEVASACRRHGVGLGLYLSPWDRHDARYPDPAAYDDVYVAQLTELCTRYGPLAELWFDGAGSTGRAYDWPRIAEVIDRLQPHAMVFNMGRPTIRWVGNEDGVATDPVEYVVERTALSQYTTETVELADALYLPPECDVSLTPGWFRHPGESPKSLEHLVAIWYRSIGLGANLLLNVPPSRSGRILDEDARRVAEWTAELARRFGRPVEAALSRGGGGEWLVDLGAERRIDHVELVEHLEDGQRVVRHEVAVADAVVAEGLTVGVRRVHALAPLTTRRLVVRLEGEGARLEAVRAFDTGGASVPDLGYLASTDAPE